MAEEKWKVAIFEAVGKYRSLAEQGNKKGSAVRRVPYPGTGQKGQEKCPVPPGVGRQPDCPCVRQVSPMTIGVGAATRRSCLSPVATGGW
jgi:hypothetical protein